MVKSIAMELKNSKNNNILKFSMEEKKLLLRFTGLTVESLSRVNHAYKFSLDSACAVCVDWRKYSNTTCCVVNIAYDGQRYCWFIIIEFNLLSSFKLIVQYQYCLLLQANQHINHSNKVASTAMAANNKQANLQFFVDHTRVVKSRRVKSIC
jgi:hypothetical protein